MKLINNASGNISKGITLDSTNKAERYKLSYNCVNIGSGKSYIRIYATVLGGYKTYFMPVQFSGQVEFELSIDSEATFLQFDMIGNATLTGITLETVVDATMQYVKENATYWDKIKDITSDTGKVRTDMLEGLINMTLNAFANESGTITQENGVMTFLNGKTVKDSTQAVQITGGAIRIANSKLPNGEWNWTTAISGAGINAATIIAETFAALTITGVTITGGTMKTGTLSGCTLMGGELFIGNEPPINGDISRYTGLKIDRNGRITGYVDGNVTYRLLHANEGRLHLFKGDSGVSIDSSWRRIYSEGGELNLYAGAPKTNQNGATLNTRIVMHEDGDIYVHCNKGSGKVIIDGDLEVWGNISADNI